MRRWFPATLLALLLLAFLFTAAGPEPIGTYARYAPAGPPSVLLLAKPDLDGYRRPHPNPRLQLISQSGPTTSQQQGGERVPILLYHHLDPANPGTNGATLLVSDFEEQMAWLRDQGFTAMTAENLAGWLAGNQELPPNPVLITFDDGYRSNYDYAFPILKRYGLKATIFVVTGTVNREMSPPHLTWDQIREMEASGVVEFGAHSHHGHGKVGGHPEMLGWTKTQLHADTETLMRFFQQNGIRPPVSYAYPFGAANDQTVQAIQSDGYRIAFTVETGFVQKNDSPWAVNRIVIFPGLSICHFSELVTNRSAGTCEY